MVVPALLDERHRGDSAQRTLAGELADAELAGGGRGRGAEEKKLQDVVGLPGAAWRDLDVGRRRRRSKDEGGHGGVVWCDLW